MSFWEAVGLMSAMTTILGVFMTIYGLINNRTLKEEAKGIREILVRIEQGQSEARKEMAEAIKYLQQGQNTLGELVRVEGERTREALRAPP